MRKIIVLVITIFTLAQCGTTGRLELPKGVEDKSEYKYPPEVDTVCSPDDLECEN